MDKRIIFARGLGILTAVIPAAIILFSHTAVWPEFAAAQTDTFYPNGPELTFSDFTPGQRTDVLKNVDGFQVRPITDAPVYILFQPRRHTKKINVEMDIKVGTLSPPSPILGYRHGETVEGNRFIPTDMKFLDGGWRQVSGEIFLEEMTIERTDAVRVLLQIPATADAPWFVRSVRIRYEN